MACSPKIIPGLIIKYSSPSEKKEGLKKELPNPANFVILRFLEISSFFNDQHASPHRRVDSRQGNPQPVGNIGHGGLLSYMTRRRIVHHLRNRDEVKSAERWIGGESESGQVIIPYRQNIL